MGHKHEVKINNNADNSANSMDRDKLKELQLVNKKQKELKQLQQENEMSFTDKRIKKKNKRDFGLNLHSTNNMLSHISEEATGNYTRDNSMEVNPKKSNELPYLVGVK